jgi:hypothetical protein
MNPQDESLAPSTESIAEPSAPVAGSVVQPSSAVFSWADWGRVAFVSIACSTLVAVGYHMLTRAHVPLPIATVDLQSVVEAKELQFTDIVTRAGATDADRDRAYQLVAKLGGELETAVNELRNECKCMVLVRAAVVGSAPNDLTASLRQKLGVAEVDVGDLREKLRQTRMAPASAVPSQSAQSISELLGVSNGRAPR